MKLLLSTLLACLLAAACALGEGEAAAVYAEPGPLDKADLSSQGNNRYFPLSPGIERAYESSEPGRTGSLLVKVLRETRMIDGVETRVIEARKNEGDRLLVVTRIFAAISRRTRDVYVFGQETDSFGSGKISHPGSWMTGVGGARPGLLMPGQPRLGQRFIREFAPGRAMGRAEVVGFADIAETPAGRFTHCLKLEETSAMGPGFAFHLFAPGVGMVQGDEYRLKTVRRVP